MTNHWATFKSSVVRWDLAFPAAMWQRWSELVRFADQLRELGRREEVYCVDHAAVHDSDVLVPDAARPTARVAVYGPGGRIEDHVTGDAGALLASLRPELDARTIPRVPALAVTGPLSLDRTEPVYVSIKLDTDLWFPWLVGEHDEPSDDGARDDDEPLAWFDNRALAERHTPRLSRFLAAVRSSALELGARWSFECPHNPRYATMVDETGVRLAGGPPASIGAPIDAAWLARVAETVCRLPSGGAGEIAAALGYTGAIVNRRNVPELDPAPRGAARFSLGEYAGDVDFLDIQLAGPAISVSALDALLGPGTPLPPARPGLPFPFAYRPHHPGAPFECQVIAYFATPPIGDALATAVKIRRERPIR